MTSPSYDRRPVFAGKRFELFVIVALIVMVVLAVAIKDLAVVWYTVSCLLGYGLFLVIVRRRRPAAALPDPPTAAEDDTPLPARRYLKPRDLPPALRSFVGREQETADIVAHLRTAAPGRPAVVLIDGPAGMGKTSLAVHAAHAVAADFPEGHLFAGIGSSLAGAGAGEGEDASRGSIRDSSDRDSSARGSSEDSSVRDSSARGSAIRDSVIHDVVGRFVSALREPGEPAPAGARTLDELLATYHELVRHRSRVLIVIDDADDEQLVAGLLPDGGSWAAIVTSRRALSNLPVQPAEVHLGRLTEAESLRLLRLIVGDERVANEPEQAREIVENTAGYPLLLQLAAVSLAARPHSSLAVALRRMGARTEDSLGGSDPLGLSYSLLTEEEQRALQALALLDESFEVWMLAVLIDARELDSDELAAKHSAADRIVHRLLHAGLVKRVNSDPASVAVFAMPGPVRQYARERLDESVPPADQQRLRARLERARGHRRQQVSGELRHRVYEPLIGGRFTEALTGARWSVAVAREREDRAAEGLALAAFAEIRAELGNFDVAEDLARAAIDTGSGPGTVRALRCQGKLRRRLRQLSQAELLLHRALTAAGDNEESEKIRVLAELAVAQSLTHRIAQAMVTLREAFRRCDECPDGGPAHRPGLIWAHGYVLQQARRLDEAQHELIAGERLAEKLDQRLWRVWLLHRRASVALDAHRLDDARGLAFDAVDRFGAMDHRYGKALSRLLIGTAHLADEQTDEAVPMLEEAAENFLNCGDRWAEAKTTWTLAMAQRRRGDSVAVARLLREAYDTFAALGDDASRARVAEELRRVTSHDPGAGGPVGPDPGGRHYAGAGTGTAGTTTAPGGTPRLR